MATDTDSTSVPDEYLRADERAGEGEHHQEARRIRALADEIERLRAGIWKAYQILGFDTDDNDTPDHLVHSHLADLIVEAATEHRVDYDAAIDGSGRLMTAFSAVISRPYDRSALVDVLVHHWPSGSSACCCGWGRLGRSHPEHVADVYEQSMAAREVAS